MNGRDEPSVDGQPWSRSDVRGARWATTWRVRSRPRPSAWSHTRCRGRLQAVGTPAEPRDPGGATPSPAGSRRGRRCHAVAGGVTSSRVGGATSSRGRGAASSRVGRAASRQGAEPSPGSHAVAVEAQPAAGGRCGNRHCHCHYCRDCDCDCHCGRRRRCRRCHSRCQAAAARVVPIPELRTATRADASAPTPPHSTRGLLGCRRLPAGLRELGPRGLCRHPRGAYAASSACARPADSPVARVTRASAATAQTPGRSGAAPSRDRRRTCLEERPVAGDATGRRTGAMPPIARPRAGSTWNRRLRGWPFSYRSRSGL